MSYDGHYDLLFQGPAVVLGEGADFAGTPGEGTNKVTTPSLTRLLPGGARGGRAAAARPLRVVTWNVLGPCWNRTPGGREADDEGAWRRRLRQQFALLADLRPDVLLLQEWWHASEAYAEEWFAWAARQRMSVFASPRTGGKPDGNAVLLAADLAGGGVDFTTLSFNDWGDRNAQFLDFEALGSRWLVVNTHLTFPQPTPHDPAMRRHQGRKLAEAVAARASGSLVVLGGDFNGNREDEAVRCIVEGTGLACHGVDEETHVDHRGNSICCDFVLTSGLEVAECGLGGPAHCLSRGFCSDHRPLLVVLSAPSGG